MQDSNICMVHSCRWEICSLWAIAAKRVPPVVTERSLFCASRFPLIGGMHLTPDEITRLSRDARVTLIAQLWDSLEDAQIPLTPTLATR
jgi:hypothetical protein